MATQYSGVLMQARPRGAARFRRVYMTTGSHAVPGSGAAKEVRFLAFAQMATGSAVPITAASEMKRKWCVKKEEVVGPCVNV